MSRIGRAPITVAKEITITKTGESVEVKGTKGVLTTQIPHGISYEFKDGILTVSAKNSTKPVRALHGFFRAHLNNLIIGVTNGWTKTLELSGVGYRAAMTGLNLTLNVGFSHPVVIEPPKGITFAVVDGKIVVSGIDKQLVGQVAANIRAVKKPEPYKGKGIKYLGEHVRRKAGKAAKAVGGAK